MDLIPTPLIINIVKYVYRVSDVETEQGVL